MSNELDIEGFQRWVQAVLQGMYERDSESARLVAESARLSAELEKCREDAERYRWLRDHSGDDIAAVTNCGVTDVGSTGVIGTYEELLDGAELDRAIDAARSKT